MRGDLFLADFHARRAPGPLTGYMIMVMNAIMMIIINRSAPHGSPASDRSRHRRIFRNRSGLRRRFARRGHDLVLVARDQARLEELASRLRAETGVKIDVVRADLTDSADLARVETRLRDDDSIGVLINNAGVSAPGGFANGDLDVMDRLIRLNVTAVTRLAGAAVLRFFVRGGGASINIAS